MENIQSNHSQKNVSRSLVGAFLLAIAASACCVLPLVLVTLGIGGVWIGSLSVLEPYRPIFLTASLALLGFAFYKVYKKPKIECTCEPAYSKRVTKTVLWVVAVVILALTSFPYIVPFVYGGETAEDAQVKQVVLEVRNMVCFPCKITVKKSLTRLDGVQEVTVSLNPPEAIVTYDPAKITIDNLLNATANAGYPSTLKREKGVKSIKGIKGIP